MLHPSGDTTIRDDLSLAAEDAGTTPQTKREAFVRAEMTEPVEQQLVNIADGLYDVKRSVEKLGEKMEKKMGKNHQEVIKFVERIYDGDAGTLLRSCMVYHRCLGKPGTQ